MLRHADCLKIGGCSLDELSALDPCGARQLCRLQLFEGYKLVILVLAKAAVGARHLELALIYGALLSLPLLLLLFLLPELPIREVAVL